MRNKYFLFFSHEPQLKWFGFLAQELRHRLNAEAVLWVIGKTNRNAGKATNAYEQVIDLLSDIDMSLAKTSIAENETYLAAFEKQLGISFYHQDAAMDRHIATANWTREKIAHFTVHILKKMQGEIDKRENYPMFVIGEENVLPYRLAHRLFANKAIYFIPHIIGHLGERFYMENTMYEQWKKCQTYYLNFSTKGIPDSLREQAKNKLGMLKEKFGTTLPMVRFITSGEGQLSKKFKIETIYKSIIRWLNYLWQKKENANPAAQTAWKQNPFISLGRVIRVMLTRWYLKSVCDKLPANLQFATFFLQVQPELSVEGLAFEFQDQAALVRTIAASLPADILLVVKEHPTMIGYRSIHFYQELVNNHNVLLILDQFNSYEVINKAKLVLTLTGTCALEAMYIGVPAIVFGQIYHENFRGIHKATDIRNLREQILEILNNPNDDQELIEENAITALAAMYAASYPGKIGACYSMAEMREPNNVKLLANAVEMEMGNLLSASQLS